MNQSLDEQLADRLNELTVPRLPEIEAAMEKVIDGTHFLLVRRKEGDINVEVLEK